MHHSDRAAVRPLLTCFHRACCFLCPQMTVSKMDRDSTETHKVNYNLHFRNCLKFRDVKLKALSLSWLDHAPRMRASCGSSPHELKVVVNWWINLFWASQPLRCTIKGPICKAADHWVSFPTRQESLGPNQSPIRSLSISRVGNDGAFTCTSPFWGNCSLCVSLYSMKLCWVLRAKWTKCL